MTEGILFYDAETDRLDVRFGDGSAYGGLHCGDCIQVLINGKWIQTCIEFDDDWYLVGLYGQIPDGLNVRI